MILHRYVVPAAAALLLTALAAPAFPQTGSQEVLSRDPARLVAVLEDPDAPVFEKAKACQRLAVVGTKEAVPALAALLAHETLADYARSGLEGIPDPAADEALRRAAGELEGRLLVGVVNSIGQRKDAGAVELLRKLLGHDDAGVVSAAAGSLGQVAPQQAVDALKQALDDASDKAALADACLVAAERLAAASKKDQAIALYEAVAAADAPKHLKADALQGQIRLLKADAKDLLLEQLRSDDETFFKLGLAMVREVPGAQVSEALLRELEKLPAERKALLLVAVGDRAEPVPLPLLAAARNSESPAVREAAIRMLARSDDPAALALLFEAALGGDETAGAAQDSLKRHRDESVDSAVVARLAEARGSARLVLLDLVAARRIHAAQPSVTAALGDADESVRAAALTALAQIIDLDDLALLIDRAKAAGDSSDTAAARGALATAALRMGDREACAARLAASMPGAPVDYQVYVLELLGRLAGEKALAAVVAGARSSEPAIKDAATRVLGEWPNAEAAPALLALAKDDPEGRYRIRALRGYLRIARQLQLSTEDRLAMFHSAMEIAQRDDERRLALDILSRIPSRRTLELAASYVDQPALRDAAADAAVKIAPRVLDSQPRAVAEAMQKVVDSGVEGDIGARSRQLLDQAQARAR